MFDNFQFVEYASLAAKYPREKRDFAFAAHALMEIPDQFQEHSLRFVRVYSAAFVS